MLRILVVLVCLAGCNRAPQPANPGDTPSSPTVAVGKVRRGPIDRRLQLIAEFRPYREIDLMAKVSGYVSRISYDIGDRVKTGAVVATLEIPEMTDDIARATASLQRSNADVSRAREEVRRAESANRMAQLNFSRLSAVVISKPGLIAQQEIDTARARSLESSAQLAAARNALESALQNSNINRSDEHRVQTMFNYTKVIAPFDGLITKRFAEVGAMVQAGTASQSNVMPVVRLSQDNMLRLQLPIPESVVSSIRVGFPVRIHVPTLARGIEATITRLSGQLALATRTMEAQVDIPNPGYLIKPGMFCEVTLHLDSHPNALLVPLIAVDGVGELRKVLVVNSNNQLVLRSVSTGIESADEIEVLSGIDEGALVLLGNRSQLKPGSKVTPKLSDPTDSSETRIGK